MRQPVRRPRRRGSQVRVTRHVAVWLGCIALMGGLVAGCGDDDDEGRRERRRPDRGDRRHRRREGHRPGVDGERQRQRHRLHGQGHRRRRHGRREGVQRAGQRRDGRPARVLDVRRRAARFVRPAPGGQLGRVRRVLVRRDLDGGVRLPEVALRPDAVRGDAPGRADRGDARDRQLRRQVLGHAAADRRGVPLLPDRPGQGGAGDLAGGLRDWPARWTASSTRARRTRA